MNERTTKPDAPHELDGLLTDWHRVNRDAAEAGRDRLLRALGETDAESAPRSRHLGRSADRTSGRASDRTGARPHRGTLATIGRSRSARAAASLLLLVGAVAVVATWPSTPAFALEIMVPDGGRLDAIDERGAVIGPCPLEHTSVDVDISGPFARVTLRQRFHNDYARKIEAVYTFPLSHRGAVDSLTMTIGDRVVVGEVKERGEARRVYEAARAQGYVASLLEQERPNIFTQSVANIEPNATVDVEISYVETVTVADGVYRFDFPMVVAPRYIPGASVSTRAFVPAELAPRRGVILRGPARLTPGQAPGDKVDNEAPGPLTAGRLQTLLEAAQPIAYPGAVWWGQGSNARLPAVWQPFEAEYVDGAKEIGWLYTDGTGQINGRWFFTDPRIAKEIGTGFAADTDLVPDASRITPAPVRPPTRAGHDISLTMTIDTGGPAIVGVDSELHEITGDEAVRGDAEGPNRITLSLRDQREIPNRDFLLTWRVAEEKIEEAHFVHRPDAGTDGFFTLMLQPPARIDDADLRSREMIFVLDSSGSMENQPIEKAKALMSRAIETMRPGDTFNVITFNDSADCLWDAPRPNTEENRRAARAYVDSRQGGGGTEMRNAVLTALCGDPAKPPPLTAAGLADLPADGRAVTVRVDGADITSMMQDGAAPSVFDIRVREGLSVRAQVRKWTINTSFDGREPPVGRSFSLRGTWITRDGRRVLDVDHAEENAPDHPAAVRFVFFLSDGEVGDDDAVIAAVREHAGRTRVFTVAIGNSPNRSLLDAMAKAGRGGADDLSLEGDPRAAVERFVRRVERPVLTDIELSFDGVAVHDTIPALAEIPDLFDEAPIVIHGRYAAGGTGTLRLAGNTGRGRFERAIELDLPERAPDNDVIATIWARAKVDERMEAGDRDGVIALGEAFGLVTAHTSFVAVEKSRMTIGGAPMLVAVPIELPAGQAWNGTFGGGPRWPEQQVELIERLGADPVALEKLAKGLLPPPPPADEPVSDYGTVSLFVPADVDAAQVAEMEQIDFVESKDDLALLDQEIAAHIVDADVTSLGDPRYHENSIALSRVISQVADAQRGLATARADHRALANSLDAAGEPDPNALGQLAQRESEIATYERMLVEIEAEGARKGDALSRLAAQQSAYDALRLRREQLLAADPLGHSSDFFSADGTYRYGGEAEAARFHEADALYFSHLTDGTVRDARVPLLGDIPLIGELFVRTEPASAAPMSAEHAVVLAVTLAKGGHPDAARRVAERLRTAQPDFDLGSSLVEVLGDESLPDDARTSRLEALAQTARDRIAQAAAAQRRAAEIMRVLAEPLWPLALPERFGEDARREAKKLVDDENRVLLTVLVAESTEATRRALASAGLGIEDRSVAIPILVGRAPARPEALVELALLDGVRRIEPTR